MEGEVILLRLGKERPGKCSLSPLRGRPELALRWLRCRLGVEVEVGEVSLLHPAGEPLTPADGGRPLLLVDSSWRDLPRVLRGVRGRLHPRRLPAGLRTAYPRHSHTHPDPATGLASVEALHAALALLGRRDDRLLDGYPWRAEWLLRNRELLVAGSLASAP